jgi:hypothetical protein
VPGATAAAAGAARARRRGRRAAPPHTAAVISCTRSARRGRRGNGPGSEWLAWLVPVHPPLLGVTVRPRAQHSTAQGPHQGPHERCGWRATQLGTHNASRDVTETPTPAARGHRHGRRRAGALMSRARAAFAFEPLPGATNQLTLTEGDALRVVNTDDREWWWVENAQGSQGYVPGAYVELEPGAEVVLPSLGPSMAQSSTLELEDVPAHRARQRQEPSSSRAAAVKWRTGAGAVAAVARPHEGGLGTAACHHSGQVDNNAEEAASLAALAASTVSEAEAAAAAAAEAAARTRELHAAAVAGDVERVALLLRPERRTVKLLRASRTQLGVLRGERIPTVEAQLDGYSERELVGRRAERGRCREVLAGLDLQLGVLSRQLSAAQRRLEATLASEAHQIGDPRAAEGARVERGTIHTLEVRACELREQRAVSRVFPPYTRSILTEIYLCHPCSCCEIEVGNPRAGGKLAAGEGLGGAGRGRCRHAAADCAAPAAREEGELVPGAPHPHPCPSAGRRRRRRRRRLPCGEPPAHLM